MTSAWSALGDVSRETLDRLQIYHELLKHWSARINLVANSTIDSAVERHFVDSAQLWAYIPPNAKTWVDLGSGAGFPGLVIAMLASEKEHPLQTTLIESDMRKCSFLKTVLRETGVSATIVAKRIEAVPPQGASVVSARALAPLPRLLPLVARHLAPDGRALLPKGQDHLREIEAARKSCEFNLDIHPSRSDPRSVILSLGRIRNV